VKGIFRVLATYDQLDSMEDQIREQLETEIEKRGPKSSKVKKLQAKLATIERKKLEAQARAALARHRFDLVLTEVALDGEAGVSVLPQLAFPPQEKGLGEAEIIIQLNSGAAH